MRILIITEYIAPVRAIAAVRWTKIGKYLNKDLNCTIDILTNPKSYQADNLTKQQYAYDASLENDLGYFNKIYEIPDSIQTKAANSIYNLFDRLRRKRAQNTSRASNNVAVTSESDKEQTKKGSSNLSYRIISALFSLFVAIRDRPRVRKYEKAGVPWEEYDVIISSYGPRWVHLIGELAKAKRPHLIWIADYRDALVISKESNTKKNRLFPSVHTGNADCITFVAPQVEGLYLAPYQNALFLSNGFDLDEARERKRTLADKFLVSITGTLYDDGTNKSDLTPLFRALTDLIETEQIDPKKVEVQYCGNNADRFLRQATPFHAIPHVCRGLVPREDALALQDESSLLVLPVWNSKKSKGIISGRIFEYLSSGTPIVALCSGNLSGSAIKDIIEQANAGFCYEEASSTADYPALVEFIKNMYLEWTEKGLATYEANIDYVNSFRYDNLAKCLFDEIKRLMAEQG